MWTLGMLPAVPRRRRHTERGTSGTPFLVGLGAVGRRWVGCGRGRGPALILPSTRRSCTRVGSGRGRMGWGGGGGGSTDIEQSGCQDRREYNTEEE